ncbi:MAG TPA: NEW3 domain-containing protein [Streptosporangiaceae bacterium]|jgi:hypothetical protein|nr:NEW3 domain-containing protein [Streptosporangiaceae bacterium]
MREVTEDQQAGTPAARARPHTVPFNPGWLFGLATTDSTRPEFDDSGNGLPDLAVLSLLAQPPAGWTAAATTDTTFSSVRGGQSVQASWQVTAPPGASPQTAAITVQSSYTAESGRDAGRAARGVTNVSVPALVPYPSLAASFSITGISSDASPADGSAADGSAADGSFDGGGSSYSAAALAAAGLAPGATVRTPDGLEYTWPDVGPGHPDNALGSGQTVIVDGRPGATRLGLLAACSGGSCYGTITVHYADGSSAIELAYLSDWAGGPNASGPDQGFTTVATLPYRNTASGKEDRTNYVYAATVPVDPAKAVVAVTLPNRASRTT